MANEDKGEENRKPGEKWHWPALIFIIGVVVGCIVFWSLSSDEVQFRLPTLALGEDEEGRAAALRALTRLLTLGVIAIAIERATEVILKLSDQNGTERAEVIVRDGTKPESAVVIAHVIAVAISLIVAIAGIGFLDTVLLPVCADAVAQTLAGVSPSLAEVVSGLAASNAELAQVIRELADSDLTLAEVFERRCVTGATLTWGQSAVFRLSDIFVTTGILAGGASGVHQIVEEIKLLVSRTSASRTVIKGAGGARQSTQALFLLNRTGTAGRLIAGNRQAQATTPAAPELPAGTFDLCEVRKKVETEGETEAVKWSVVLPVLNAEGEAVTITADQVASAENHIKLSPVELSAIISAEHLVHGSLIRLVVSDVT